MRSLGEDACLGDAVWMLDEHYGIMMTFDALSKEVYSLKQGMGKNVAEFRVHQSYQVQILQMENPSRIHVEGVKQDCFYEDLSPEYWWMLAHKVNGENSVTYSKLLLTAWMSERWAEVRDALLPKTPTTGTLNVTHSHSQGNLFPSRKLKDNHTFTPQSTAVEDHETEEDSGPKPDREKETESSAEEDAGMIGKVSDLNPLLGFVVQFANVVELYQKRELQLLWGVGSLDHPVKDCLREMWKTARKVGLNLKEGTVKKGGWSSQKVVATQEATPGDAP